MKRWDLTWVDWTLIALGIFLLLQFPALNAMNEDAERYDAIRKTMGDYP